MTDPSSARQLADAQAALARGDFAGAAGMLQRVLRSAPDTWQAHYGIGWIHLQSGNPQAALQHLTEAAARRPTEAGVLRHYAEALAATGRLVDGVAMLRHVLEIAPREAEVHRRLGQWLHDLGQTADAALRLQEALRLNPLLADAYNDLGMVHFRAGDVVAAAQAVRMAATIDPAFGAAYASLGLICQQAGSNAQAIAAYRRALAIRPAQPGILSNLAIVAAWTKDHETAAACALASVRLDPGNLDLQINRVVVLSIAKAFPQALARARAIVATWPAEPAAYAILSGTHESATELTVAAIYAQRGVQLAPESADAHVRAASLLHLRGHHAEAANGYRTAYRCRPPGPAGESPLIYVEAYGALSTPATHRARAEAWFDRHFGNLPAPRPFRQDRSPDRRLRVGYVSPDLRMHSVSFFIGPIFAAHDRAQIEVIVYATGGADAVTGRLRGKVDRWHDAVGLSTDALYRRIREDQIDILVDLSGHLMGHSLAVFARRAAPVQLSYLGYFGTTGVRTMDYWLSDAVLHPPDTTEAMTETIWRLPRCWVAYDPWPDSPAVRLPPPSPDHGLTFGSFNSSAKITLETIALWSRVLAAVPRSRLLLKSITLGGAADHMALRRAFACHGIAPQRLVFMPPTPDYRNHLDLYGEIDIVLDPIPLTGGTTTADALWMGAPVLTLCGQRMMERMTASMLTTIGLDDWITETPDDYVAQAVSHAADIGGRRALRQRQRDMVIASGLTDGRSLAAALDHAYREMWQRWVTGRARSARYRD